MPPTSRDLTRLAESNEIPPAVADELLALGQEREDELPGGVVGYEVGERIGVGGMGAVYVARHPTIRREVAVKLLSPDCDEAERLRFVAEAQITGQLEHPNIVPVHELAIDAQGRPYYAMKLVRGMNLRATLDRLARGDRGAIARYPLVVLLTIFQKVCDAVAFAHSRGVIHRDLKPANVMVGDFGEVMVMDWGVAKVLDRAEVSAVSAVRDPVSTARTESAGACDTRTGTVIGTPHYMAPEQASGDSDAVDERADIYSLGAILFHLLMLRPPVAGESAREVIDKVAAGQVETVLTHTGPLPHLPEQKIPDSLPAVVRRAMAFRREDRYGSVLELQREIGAYQRGFATEAERASLWKHFSLFVGRHRTASIVAAVGLGLVAAVAATLMLNVIRERNRAELAIENLRRSAPAFFEQSRTLASQQKFEGALARIDAALLCVPERAAYHAQRGNVLQALRRFDEAAASYLQAFALDPRIPSARENAALSSKLAELARQGPIPANALHELERAWREQGRGGEVLSLAAELRVPVEQQLPLWRERLRLWLGTEADLTLGRDGSFTLNLNGQPIDDLTPLRGIPLTRLWLESTKVKDLSPLAGMPLEDLRVSNTAVSDLEPLRRMALKTLRLGRCPNVKSLAPLAGMPLEELNIGTTPVSDLSPLRGVPLRSLFMNGTLVSDLSPLKGMRLEVFSCGSRSAPITDIGVLRSMPLRSASLINAAVLTNLRPLEDCRELEELFLPPNPEDIGFLRQLPRLKYIVRRGGPEGERTQTAAEFWAEYDREHQEK
jgi:serine/threonine protein kinase